MGQRDPRVDAYIAKAPAFAKPILIEIRERVHAACPDVAEDIKWSHPQFIYRGSLCSMTAFMQHAVVHLWGESAVPGGKEPKSSGPLTSVADLPPRKAFAASIKKVMALNEAGATMRRAPRAAPKPIVVPDDLVAALRKNVRASAAFDKFPPSHKREYVEWITGAKREETRARRLETAIRQIAEGKPQNWKYMK